MSDETLTCLVYVSSATRQLSASNIEEILIVSRRNNPRIGVTGMLLYYEGSFIQAIEGPEQAVFDLMEKIRKDERHRDDTIIAVYPIEARQFPDWSMGSRKVKDSSAESMYEAFADLREPIFDRDNAEKNSVARKLLEGFRLRNLA